MINTYTTNSNLLLVKANVGVVMACFPFMHVWGRGDRSLWADT